MASSAVDLMWKRGSSSSVSRGGFVGTSGKFPSGSRLQSTIRDAMINGTSSYRDIDNAFSAGGHNGNGSPQSSVVKSGSVTSGSKKRSSYRGSSGGYSGSSGGSSGGYFGGSGDPIATSASDAFDYYEAPIAQKYGFSKTTAYQEALANTAYRREMADMRKAGLNPSVIYGSHNTSGADSGIIPRDDFAPISYGGSGRSGGYGGSGRRSRGGNSGKYVFSGGAYYGIMAGVGAITAMSTHNVGAGMAAAGLAGTAMKALNGFLKK